MIKQTLREAAIRALALVQDTLLERAIDTKRLSAIGRDLESALAADPAQPRLSDEDFAKFWLASTSDVDVSKSFAALALHYGRAVEAEVRRRCGVVE